MTLAEKIVLTIAITGFVVSLIGLILVIKIKRDRENW